ncbi:hypothetical protein COO60DRAFT_1626630 [Scenedesmus sp. NREL 46B-D3]|nr:hypothetical protein COO60DRAFT_1626630 [Scenedesmus sp. NREL 46B-D3]
MACKAQCSKCGGHMAKPVILGMWELHLALQCVLSCTPVYAASFACVQGVVMPLQSSALQRVHSCNHLYMPDGAHRVSSFVSATACMLVPCPCTGLKHTVPCGATLLSKHTWHLHLYSGLGSRLHWPRCLIFGA